MDRSETVIIIKTSSAAISDSNNTDFQNNNTTKIEIEKLLDTARKYYFSGDYNQSIIYLDKILEIEPNYTSALYNKGNALYNLGQLQEALKYYDKVLKIDGNNTNALSNKEMALKDKYIDAIKLFDKALTIVPDDLSIIFNKGLTLVQLGNYSQAIDLVQPYLNENPDNKDLLCVIKNAYEKLNHISLANYYRELLLELDPSYWCIKSELPPIHSVQSTQSDFNITDNDFSPNAKLIAHDITFYNETEIKDYPLTDLPPEEIRAVFTILDSGNLSKVLLNVPPETIKEISNKLSEEKFEKILNRLPNETINIIKGYVNN